MTKNKKYTQDFLMELMTQMWLVRKFEQSASDSFLKGQISGNLHVCIGEEAAIVGANAALEKRDYISASHRGHGHCLMKSKDVNGAMAELFGKESGLCKGRGGSMHVTKVESGLLGANGIVGGGIPIATGSALASKVNGDDAVTIAFMGDGATNQGCFHECINMAAVWKLPIVYFIENNGYAVSVEISSVTNTESLAERAKAYQIPGEVIDGTDVLAVYEATKQAVEHARSGNGPTLIDCKMYKFTGHFVGDPAAYLPQEYKDKGRALDPIERFRQYILKNKAADEQALAAAEKRMEAQIAAAKEFAMNSPLPGVETLLEYNYTSDNERSVAR